VNRHDLGLTGLDPDLGEHGHELLPEGVQLLLGVPDLADSKLALLLVGLG
jgi:hypothetical protein